MNLVSVQQLLSQGLDQYNPIQGTFRVPSVATGNLSILGQITSKILPITLIAGGFFFLAMLISGGLTMETNPTNPEAQEAGKRRITWAVVGFFLLFSSYWIFQIIEIIFGLNVLNTPR